MASDRDGVAGTSYSWLDILRFLSPFILGGVGLYVSLVVSPLIEKLERAEKHIALLDKAVESVDVNQRDFKAYKEYVLDPHLKVCP